jgi:hypothetical protein
MAQFTAFSPAVEVNGETVLSVVAGMGSFSRKALEILAAEGIQSPAAGNWYSQTAWLRAFRTIADGIGENTLYRIGTTIPENANFPPEINDLVKAMESIDVAYHMNHRGGEIGNYAWRSTSDHSGAMTCHNPYPCDFDRGIIDAMSKRFRPQSGGNLRVAHASTGPCRKRGDDDCTYTVAW